MEKPSSKKGRSPYVGRRHSAFRSAKKIAEIAEALGYSSAEHFSSAFRRYHHVSPWEYRKEQFS
ncbi:MAG: helix-turn-helix domain-containing protein [Lachnospiraceae bacterium]